MFLSMRQRDTEVASLLACSVVRIDSASRASNAALCDTHVEIRRTTVGSRLLKYMRFEHVLHEDEAQVWFCSGEVPLLRALERAKSTTVIQCLLRVQQCKVCIRVRSRSESPRNLSSD